MNHVYRLIWSHRCNGWVAVSEIARGRKKGGRGKLIVAAMALVASVAQAGPGPTGGHVVSGTGQISSSGDTTTITQSSQNLSLTWQSFNIAPQDTVNFVQPSASAVAVNSILGNNGTQILGHLNANGQVYLINPNGILFGPGSQVDVGGLVASTLGANAASPGGTTRSFGGSGTGSVINEGTITAASGGYVALLGNRVSNSGTIVAQSGGIGLGAGSAVTLTFAGDSLVSVQVDRSTLNNLAANGGLIRADGGKVIMTAGARDALLASVVNNTGVIEARTLEDHDGTIALLGGMTAGQVDVGGTLDASAPNGGNGGNIETSAATVKVSNGARITSAAPRGLTGSWLVDPQDFTVAASGGDITGIALSAELTSNNIQLQSSGGGTSGSGNVNVDAPVTWSTNTTLTLTASNNVNINANLTATGANAGLVISPNTANGSETASGTGAYSLNNGSSITLAGANPGLSISGHTYTVINSLGAQGSATGTDLQGMNGYLTRYYALGSNINASATSSWNSGAGFAPIGSYSAAFTGTFDGLGHVITNLTIDRPSGNFVGLFGLVGSAGVIQNVGLAGGSVVGSQWTGGLAGENNGTVSNASATGTVNGSYYVGGLVGLNYGAIKSSFATGFVSSSSYCTGGLVGTNGTYSNHSGATITNSYATGATTSTAAAVGGLVGVSYGSIADSYATGSASSTGSNRAEVGGLLGAMGGGSISNSYATGLVSASRQMGGLVGVHIGGSVTGSSWDTTTTGQSSSPGGGTGLTTAQMQTASNFSGFNFTSTPGQTGNNWVMVDADGSLNNAGSATGDTFPMLASEYATTLTNAHQLQLMAMAPAANYSLGATINAAATSGTGNVWINAGGFVPIGTASAPYAGTFNGSGYTISSLTIDQPSSNDVGLFGYVGSAGVVLNVGLVAGSVTGGIYTGALVSANSGTISSSYAVDAVTGSSFVGGLVGSNNSGTVSNSYAAGAVTGSTSVGGLVGLNTSGTVSRSYATGAVSGSSTLGGLVGSTSAGTVINSFWDQTTTGQSSSAGGTGLITSPMQQQGTYSGWDFSGTWVMYSGQTYPLLRVFMTPLTVTANNASLTYNASAYSGGNGVSYSATPNGNLLGSLAYSGSSQGAINAGSYALTPAGLYSNQQGYIISDVSGVLTVNPATLTVSSTSASNKVYDGTSTASLTGGTLSGIIGSDSVSLIQAGSFATANVGNGIAVTASDSLSGAAAGNYTFTQPTGLSANITVATLTVNSTNVSNKVYDGTSTASLTGGTLSGVMGSGSVILTQAGTFATANAGTGLAVTASDSLSGAAAGNYTLTQPTGLSGNIIPATLTVNNTSVSNKVYDGTSTASLTGGTLSGIIGSGSVMLTQAGTFATANAGSGIAVTASDSLSGAAAGNYTVAQPTGLSASITPATLTVSSTNASNKVYDGTSTASLTGGTLSGIIGSDSVSLIQAGSFATANVGNGIAVNASDSLSGAAAGNYTVTQPTGLSAAIIPATLIYTASPETVLSGRSPSGLSGTVSGFVTGDTLANATAGTPAWTTSVTASSQPGSYAVDGTGLTAGNYVFTQAASNATALTVSAVPFTFWSVASLETTILTDRGSCTSVSGGAGACGGTESASDVSVNAAVIEATLSLGSQASLRILDGGVRLPDELTVSTND